MDSPAVTSRRRQIGLAQWVRSLLRDSKAQIGLVLVGINVFLTAIGPVIAPYSPFSIGVGEPLSGPSVSHLMGTDVLGRDVLSRFLHGGRYILLLPLAAVLISGALGGSLGLWSGFRGGFLDDVTARLVDVLISIPPLLIGMIVVFAVGTSPPVLVGVVTAFFVPRIFRVVRGATHAVIGQDYILAARARGESAAVILSNEILPNISGPVLAELGMRLSVAIIFIATLNFLGLGIQPPSPDWGLMVSENRIILAQLPLATLMPALGIASIAVGVNLIADGVGRQLAHEVSSDVRL